MNSNSDKRIYGAAAVLVVLLVLGHHYFFGQMKEVATPANPTTNTSNHGTTGVVRTESGSANTVPAEFPADIPVGPSLTESYHVEYPAHHATQSTVSFTTTKSPAAILKQYADFFKSSGYTTSLSSDKYLEGSKDNQTLSVAVGQSAPGQYKVILNLLVH